MDIEQSEAELLETDREYVLNSGTVEFQRENYIKIDNTELNAVEAAKLIKEEFNF